MDRRTFLAGAGVGLGALAGCLGVGGSDPGPSDDGGGTGPPLAEGTLPVADPFSRLRDRTVSGGPGKDGIPAVDDPAFLAAGAADLDPGDVVFGVVVDGDARAYPQHVLVWHEVVNDTVGGLPVSVTYCPLTGTALGFERGGTTFGVSGDLVGSNLVMYDRATDSRWPQVLATAVAGAHEGASLRGVPVVWTTWGAWCSVHPDTRVLSESTGYVRNYDTDPYGGYNPRSGYYEGDGTLFRPLHPDDRFGRKEPFLAARESAATTGTTATTVAVRKATLRERGVVPTDDYLAVYDPALDSGTLYRTAGTDVDRTAYEWVDGRVRGPEGTHDPTALPLDRATAFDAMWFAWAGFYPDTEVHG